MSWKRFYGARLTAERGGAILDFKKGELCWKTLGEIAQSMV